MRELSFENLNNNFDLVKDECKKKVCVMTKADAYGHGLVEVCQSLKNKADYFGVATIFEAQKIRDAGIKNKIVVVGKSEFKDLKIFFENHIEMSVFSLEEIERLEEICAQNNLKIGVHIKINSGMNRLGVKTIKEYNLMQNVLKTSKNLKFCGIFTHFCSISGDKAYFEKQKNLFKLFVLATEKCFKPLVHVGGSESLGEVFDFGVDMFRTGLAIYGYSKNLPVKPVLRIKSKILQTNEILPYEMTGYFPCQVSSRLRRTATVFYGYVDGISKRATNKCFVKIHDQKCEILSVCMDMIIVDVTNVVCREGDEVVIFDDANDWANALGLIPYEVLTGFKNLRKH